MSVLLAYRQVEEVEPSQMIKYHELFGTWRTSGPAQGPLFGEDIQKRIEGGVFGHWRPGGDSQSSAAYQSGARGQPAAASPMEKANVLYDLRQILNARQQIAEVNPCDSENAAQISTLQQLEQLVISQQLSLIQVEEIRGQLAQIRPPSPPPPAAVVYEPPPPSAPEQLAYSNILDPAALANLSRMLEQNPSLLLQAAQSTLANAGKQEQERIQEAMQDVLAHSQSEKATANAAAAVRHPDLAQGLANSGLFSSEQIADALAFLNSATAATVKQEISRQPSAELVASTSATTLDDPYLDEYENMVAALDVELTNSSISRARPELSDFLYDRIPQFCRQDGARFLNGPMGDKRSAAHLDAHFRYHRTVREGVGRVQQRVWATMEGQWILSHDFGDGLDDSVVPGKGKVAESAALGSSVPAVDPKTLTVSRPSDPVLAARPCPVCREPFETRFDDDEDDFIWINAVEVDGAIWHGTCHAEAVAARLKNKLKVEDDVSRVGSRGGTPGTEGTLSRATPFKEKVLGKRKSSSPELENRGNGDEIADTKRVKAEPND